MMMSSVIRKSSLEVTITKQDQLAVPSKDCVWRDDRGDTIQPATSEWFAFGRETPPLVVSQAQPLLALELADTAELLVGPRAAQVGTAWPIEKVVFVAGPGAPVALENALSWAP